MKIRQSAPERRRVLLETALNLFSTQGYDGTTTRAIAAAAGVTEALLFKHFRTKQELLASLVAEYKPERIFSPPPSIIHELPASEALSLMVRRYLDAFWENRAFMRMLFTTPRSDRAIYAEIWEEFARQGVYLYVLLQELEDRRELKAGVSAGAAEIISTSVSGFLVRVLDTEPDNWNTEREKFVQTLTAIILEGTKA